MSPDAPKASFAPPPKRETETHPAEAAPTRQPGRIATFYSFKGGVGRSMALANVAVMAAALGEKVLIVDFDLEAPGLEHFFTQHDHGLADRLAASGGVIDLLQPKPQPWRDCVQPIELPSDAYETLAADRRGAKAPPTLHILHSGKASRDHQTYADQVQTLNWQNLYTEHQIGARFVEYRTEWAEDYDLVFVDSRTGVTDIGDLCTVVLPDHLVMLFVTNEQNIDGIKNVYERAVDEHAKLPVDDRSRLTVLPILSRDEFYSEYERSNEWRRRAARELTPLFADWLPKDVSPIGVFQRVFIPYFAIWSFGEALPVVDNPESLSNPASINAAYARVARLLRSGLDWSSLDDFGDPTDLAQARAEQTREQEAIRDEYAARLKEEEARLEEERARMREEIARQEQAIGAELAEEQRRSRRSERIRTLVVLATLVIGSVAFAYQTNKDADEARGVRAALEKSLKESESRRAQLERDVTRALEEATTQTEDLQSQFADQRAQSETLIESLRAQIDEQTKRSEENLAKCNAARNDVQRIAAIEAAGRARAEGELTRTSSQLDAALLAQKDARTALSDAQAALKERETTLRACIDRLPQQSAPTKKR